MVIGRPPHLVVSLVGDEMSISIEMTPPGCRCLSIDYRFRLSSLSRPSGRHSACLISSAALNYLAQVEQVAGGCGAKNQQVEINCARAEVARQTRLTTGRVAP